MKVITATEWCLREAGRTRPRSKLPVLTEANVLLAMFMLTLNAPGDPWSPSGRISYMSRSEEALDALSAMLGELGFTCGLVRGEPDFGDVEYYLDILRPALGG